MRYDYALPYLIQRYFPTGLIGLGVTALLAGFMAGQAGNVTAFNTVFTYDIYQPVFKKNASDSHLVWVGRVMTIVGIIISVATAYLARQFGSIMDYVQAIFAWVNAPLFATMLLGMFWKRTTPSGAFWGLLVGMTTSFLLFMGMRFGWFDAAIVTFAENPSDMARNLWQAWWAWSTTFCVTIAVSFATKPQPESELLGLVRGLIDTSTSEEKVEWWRTPGFWAIVAFVVLIALNIYFW